jgi:hypothetical protein
MTLTFLQPLYQELDKKNIADRDGNTGPMQRRRWKVNRGAVPTETIKYGYIAIGGVFQATDNCREGTSKSME